MHLSNHVSLVQWRFTEFWLSIRRGKAQEFRWSCVVVGSSWFVPMCTRGPSANAKEVPPYTRGLCSSSVVPIQHQGNEWKKRGWGVVVRSEKSCTAPANEDTRKFGKAAWFKSCGCTSVGCHMKETINNLLYFSASYILHRFLLVGSCREVQGGLVFVRNESCTLWHQLSTNVHKSTRSVWNQFQKAYSFCLWPRIQVSKITGIACSAVSQLQSSCAFWFVLASSLFVAEHPLPSCPHTLLIALLLLMRCREISNWIQERCKLDTTT